MVSLFDSCQDISGVLRAEGRPACQRASPSLLLPGCPPSLAGPILKVAPRRTTRRFVGRAASSIIPGRQTCRRDPLSWLWGSIPAAPRLATADSRSAPLLCLRRGETGAQGPAGTAGPWATRSHRAAWPQRQAGSSSTALLLLSLLSLLLLLFLLPASQSAPCGIVTPCARGEEGNPSEKRVGLPGNRCLPQTGVSKGFVLHVPVFLLNRRCKKVSERENLWLKKETFSSFISFLFFVSFSGAALVVHLADLTLHRKQRKKK